MAGGRRFVITPLTDATVPSVAALLAEAFQDDPAYSFLIPDPTRRYQGLHDFFVGNLRTHLPYRCTQVLRVEGTAQPLATVTLRPPGGVPVSLWTMLHRGLLPFTLRHGIDAARRLLRLKDVYDALEVTTAGGRPHYYVHMMAVGPDQQGTGLGTTLLKDVLGRCPGNGCHPTVLTTHEPRNVTFYTRAGFELVEKRQLRLRPDSQPYDVWCMRR